MKRSEAWIKWPEHNGHDLGYSQITGKPQCKTCGYVTLSDEQAGPINHVAANEIINPFWT